MVYFQTVKNKCQAFDHSRNAIVNELALHTLSEYSGRPPQTEAFSQMWPMFDPRYFKFLNCQQRASANIDFYKYVSGEKQPLQ